MLDRIGTFKRGGHSRNGVIHLAENPKHPRHENQHGHSSVLAGCPSSYSVGLLTCVEQLDSAFERLTGFDKASHEHENHPLSSYSIEQCWPITAPFLCT